MNINDIINIYNLIRDRLPKTYPKPKLIFFEDEVSMLINSNLDKENETVYALYCPSTKLVSICNNIFELSNIDIAKVLLHEINHAYAHQRYGYKSKQFNDESACNRFAARWTKKINIKQDNKRFLGWSETEIKYLKKYYAYTKKQIILNKINRSWKAIQSKAHKINVKRLL